MSNENENDDLFGDVTPEVAPEVAPEVDVEALAARAQELRASAQRARADAESADLEACALERTAAECRVEPTLQETNEYIRRLDAAEQEQRIAMRAQIAQLGFKIKRAPHPPLFTR